MSELTENILSVFVDSSQKKDFYENRGKNATELNSCADLKLNAAGKHSNSRLQTKTANRFHSLEDSSQEDKLESAGGTNETQISDFKPNGAFCVDELVGVDSRLQTVRPKVSTEQDCCSIRDIKQTPHADLSPSAAIRYLNEMYSWADRMPTAETFHSLEDSSQGDEDSVSGTNENPVSAFKPNVFFKCVDDIGKTEGSLRTASPEDYYGTSETNAPTPKPAADVKLNAVINCLNGVYSRFNSNQQPNQKESQGERLAKHAKLLEEEILKLRDRCNTQQKQIQDHKDEKQKIKREKSSLEKQKRQLETAKWKVEQERRQVHKEKETLCNEKNTLEDIKLQLREETELLEEEKRLFQIKTKEFKKRKADETLHVALARLRETKNQPGTTRYLEKPKIQSETMDRLDQHLDFFEDLKQTLERKQSQSEGAEDSDTSKHPDEPFKDIKLQLDELKPDPDVQSHLDDQNSHSSVMKRLDEHMDFFQDLQLQLDQKQRQSEEIKDSDTFKHPDEPDELFEHIKLHLDELKPDPDVQSHLDEQNVYSSEVRRLDEHMDFFEDLKQTLERKQKQSETTKHLDEPETRPETSRCLDEHFCEDHKQKLEDKREQCEVVKDSDTFKLLDDWLEEMDHLDDQKPDSNIATHLDDQNSHSSVMKRLDEHMDFFQDLQLQLDQKQRQSEEINDSDTFKHPDEPDEPFEDVKLQLDELKPDPDVQSHLDEQNVYSSEVRRLDEHMDFFEDLKQTLERKQKQSETTKHLDEPETRPETSRRLDEHFCEDHKQKLEDKREQCEVVKDSDTFKLLDDWLEEMEHLNDQKPDSNIATHLDDQNSHSSVMKRLDEHMDFFQDLQLQLDQKQRQSEEIKDSDTFKHPDEPDEPFEHIKLHLDELKPDPDVQSHLDEQNVYSSVMKRLDEHMDFFQDLQLQLDKGKNSRRQQETQTHSNM
nr:trichohyalin-like [Nothobranchius furzeri]